MLFLSSPLFPGHFFSLFHEQCQPFWNSCSLLDLPPLLSELSTDFPVTPLHPLKISASNSLPPFNHILIQDAPSKTQPLYFCTINHLFLFPTLVTHSLGPAVSSKSSTTKISILGNHYLCSLSESSGPWKPPVHQTITSSCSSLTTYTFHFPTYLVMIPRSIRIIIPCKSFDFSLSLCAAPAWYKCLYALLLNIHSTSKMLG